MKRFLKSVVVSILAKQVRLLRKKHDIKVIGVVGGIGKTSTKFAITQLLGTTLRVRSQEGNYNDIVSVPLVFFGHSMPSLFNPLAWMKVFASNAKQIRGEYPFDAVILELGTDRPGHIAEFQQYLKLDYAVITAIVPEHMAYFADMQAVADEELSVAKYAGKLIYNNDLVEKKYSQTLEGAISYGMQPAHYRLTSITHSKKGIETDVTHNDKPFLHFIHQGISEVQLYSALAAIIVGKELGLTKTQLLDGVAALTPVKGRLQRLNGINDSVIIDDTYNALPDAMKASLAMFYTLKAPQKIAILGSMNQLGAMSPEAHKEIGELCDPAQLSLVVTVGPDANTYLAPVAKAKGCTVKSFRTPYEAGEYLKTKVKKGTLIFAKGSQDKVYTEEAIKPLLANPKDASKLVRQSAHWLKLKQKSFQQN